MVEQREKSAANLREIALAVNEYVSSNGVLPGYGEKFSWRVALLPFLGHGDLYQQFHHDEPWNTDHNLSVGATMPDVFRVPGDEGNVSGYEIFGNKNTISPKPHGMEPKQVVDGLANTLMLIQIDRRHRKLPWTAPSAVSISLAREKVAPDGDEDPLFLVMWADGHVTAIEREAIHSGDFAAAITPAAADAFNLARSMKVMGGAIIHQPSAITASIEPDPTDVSSAPASSTSASAVQPIESAKPLDRRLPVPSNSEQRRAQDVVRELFLKRYEAADNPRDRKKIAAEIFEKSTRMGDDVAGEFAMVTTAIKIALQANDIETADKGVQHLVDRFQFDTYEMKLALLRKTDKLTTATAFDTRILDGAIELLKEAAKRDEYDVAKEMAEVGLTAARRINHKETASELVRVKQELDRVSAAYGKMRAAMEQVGDPSKDAVVSEQAGKFYCFFKGDWDRGLPFLARSSDPELRGLAQSDLDAPVDHAKQIALADGWFRVADQMKAPESQFARQRALHWYEAALSTLPDGLARLKAEVRLNELRAELQR